MGMYYRLNDDNTISEVNNVFESNIGKRVMFDQVGNVIVSTVFLGLNHSMMPGTDPILFEGMIFGGEFDGEQDRYYTYDDAIRGHECAVKLVKLSQED